MSGWSAPTALLPVSARYAGGLWLLGSVQFILLGLALTLAAYPGHSILNGHISDLGSSHSPFALFFNRSIELLGVMGALGVLLVRGALAPGRASRLGLGLLFLASAAAVAVGLFPEDFPGAGPTIHALASASVFVGAALALLLVSRAIRHDRRWAGLPSPTALTGVVMLLATGVYVVGFTPYVGSGGMESLIVAPLLLWLLGVGSRLARTPPFAPRPLLST
ncbi:MAG: DUF998 domain-containing protein [Thermoplasmata archaeon]|nr:DUF998 domain-containing protein [Thermoplasmata archaeon]